MMRSFGKVSLNSVFNLIWDSEAGREGGGLGGFYIISTTPTLLTVSIPFAISPNPPPPKLALSSYRHEHQRIFEGSRGHAGRQRYVPALLAVAI